MKINYLLLISLLFLACAERDADYWIKPENQQGRLFGFHSTTEYCKKVMETTEFLELDSLQEQVSTLRNANEMLSQVPTSDSVNIMQVTNKIIHQLDSIEREYLDFCGGYCGYGMMAAPALPYRVDDSQYFLKRENTRSMINRSLAAYTDKLNELINQYDDTNALGAITRLEKNIVDQSTIAVLIRLQKLRMAILTHRDAAANTIKLATE